jgi:malate/lactate dehydrogenase
MKRSDVDIMFVVKDVNVYEDINSARLNSAETCVAMEMEETKLGFSRLRLINCNNNIILEMCKQVGVMKTDSIFKAIHESFKTSHETRNEIFGSPY